VACLMRGRPVRPQTAGPPVVSDLFYYFVLVLDGTPLLPGGMSDDGSPGAPTHTRN